MRHNTDRRPADSNVVPFVRPRGSADPRAAARREASARASRRRVDLVEESALDRPGSVVTLLLFVLSSLFNAWLLLAAFGVRL